MLFIRHCQSSHLLSLLFSYLHTTINLLILQAGSRRIASRISESRPVSVIAFLHLLYLIFQHTLDFVAHGFPAGLAEMNPHNLGSPSNLLHQCGSVLSRCCGGSVLCDFFAAHRFSNLGLDIIGRR